MRQSKGDVMSDTDSTAAEIAAIIKGIFNAFADNNPDGIDGHMHPDSTVWDVFTPHLIQGQAERDAFHAADQEQMQARGPLTLNVEEPVVSSWDNTAIAMYYLD